MSKSETTLTDAEWEAKFNGPRDRLLKEIFGDKTCPVKDISPKVVIKDKNWDKGEDFMVSGRPRIHKNMNPDTRGIAKWNEQMHASGKVVSVVHDKDLENLKAKPDPVK